jgi:hypothetical protein
MENNTYSWGGGRESTNRRRRQRIPDVEVRKVRVTGERQSHKAELIDVSFSGCALQLAGDSGLAMGDELEVEILRSAIRGRIIYVQPVTDTLQQIGIEFQDVNPAAVAKDLSQLLQT